jgi:hypothetical protein
LETARKTAAGNPAMSQVEKQPWEIEIEGVGRARQGFWSLLAGNMGK